MRRSIQQHGISLVELLIVIAIIGLLVQLLLPAVQASREAARQTQCKNNLKQLGTACMLHEGTFRRFPCGGWGTSWIPDPDRGNDDQQPGGWTYNVLPFLEQSALHQLGRGLKEPARQAALEQLLTTPVAVFYCPTRRRVAVYPANNVAAHLYPGAEQLVYQAKSDYAANSGDYFTGFWAANPEEREIGPWIDQEIPNENYSGVIYHRSLVEARQIVDGTSKTFLAGEKLCNIKQYDTRDDIGDAHTLYTGASWQNCRWTRIAPSSAPFGPAPDSSTVDGKNHPGQFGSAHASGCNFVFCDGSVLTISYEIDADVFRWRGNREDSVKRVEYTSDGIVSE